MRSYVYIKFDRPLEGASWSSLQDARHYVKFRKDVFNTCRQKKLPSLEDFFSEDIDTMIEQEHMDEAERDSGEIVEEWFDPAEAMVVVRTLRESFANGKDVPFRSLFLNFLDDLMQKLTLAKDHDVQFHLEFEGSA